MNALNANIGHIKETHKNVSQFIKPRMYDTEALECQYSI